MSEFGGLFLSVIGISLIGGVVLWILARLCTTHGASFGICALGAVVTEILLLFPIPVLPFIALYALFITSGRMHGFPALVSVMVFMALRLGLIGGATMLVQTFAS